MGYYYERERRKRERRTVFTQDVSIVKVESAAVP